MSTKKYKQIRRVRITGPASERQASCDWIAKNGYRVITGGCPRSVGKGPYVRDLSKFYIVAEKEI